MVATATLIPYIWDTGPTSIWKEGRTGNVIFQNDIEPSPHHIHGLIVDKALTTRP